MLIDGIYYDTAKLAAIHPGGELMVMLCNGQDGTTIFNSYHRRSFPHEKYTTFTVPADQVDPSMKDMIKPNHQSFEKYFELVEQVKPIIATTKGFAPPSYFLKVLAILTGVVFLDLVYPMFWRRPWYLSCLLGWFLGLIGLCIQHDSNHGSVSRNPLVNRLLGLGQDYLGGGSIAWMVNHNTIHHVHCNDVELDHDLGSASPVMRLHSKADWHFLHVFQQFYFVILEIGFGPLHIVSSAIFLWSKSAERELIFEKHRNVCRALTLLVPLRFLILLTTCDGPWDALCQMLITNSVGGCYLAFFFLLSHNFEGVKKDGINSLVDCFVKNQCVTSSNVGYAWLAEINGGLNYQIEHHLFPRVHHSYYAKIAPVCRKFCEKNGYQYIHFPTVWDNFISTARHLAALGKKPVV
eukprot:GILI01006667.1.p1 GENE.GILI01006667.1~~GILI01006667.1.p1  ORF type:complete len:420 (-),score=68.52 GILI01006667.1:153-1376(-)